MNDKRDDESAEVTERWRRWLREEAARISTRTNDVAIKAEIARSVESLCQMMAGDPGFFQIMKKYLGHAPLGWEKIVIHVRLDAETERIVVRLKRQFGWSDSQLVHEGIKLLNGLTRPARRRVKGLGCFASGVPDLGSHKSHFNGFGR